MRQLPTREQLEAARHLLHSARPLRNASVEPALFDSLLFAAEERERLEGEVEKYKTVSEKERGDWINRVAKQRANAERIELTYLRAHKQLREQHAALTHKRAANRKLREQIVALRQERDEAQAERDQLAAKLGELRRLAQANTGAPNLNAIIALAQWLRENPGDDSANRR